MPVKVIPERVRWAVETMGIRPTDRILEIGCGRGSAVSLICERLDGGRVTAIDRSITMIKIAEERNEANVAAGKVVFQAAALDAANLDGERFDKVFAINVNLFWVRSSKTELDRVRRLLTPGGAMYLFYEPPDSSRAAAIADRIAPFLNEHGFTTTVSMATTSRSMALVCLKAEARPSVRR
ncbi:SAM-dependent methyltransferase [Micromonospora sp. CPCC 206061]|uniref:SAM-dependent methyltransferase n=1 Tax=Micromonospora sp. CPCC 206061 TaxID=3122410 RepID=UPI002FEF263B